MVKTEKSKLTNLFADGFIVGVTTGQTLQRLDDLKS